MDQATEVFKPLQADDPPSVAGYRLAARLGAGGMGRVYLSYTRGGRPVAIKVVRPELADDPAFRQRFRREVEAARRVRGAYTAELIDAEADGTPPWLATLYVPGPALDAAVARRGPLPVPAVLWLMAGVAEALQAIHGAGIVHRDLKPSNVLLAADGPRVIDFGISLTSGVTALTATGATVGTPSYMAPEQASSGEITAATDVFSLGQTAAFAALGRPLYRGGSSVGVLYQIVHSRPDLSPLPDEIRPLIARCLAADPEERATPAEVVEQCRKLLGADAEAGAGPAVWREVRGTEVTIPPPVADLTPVHTLLLADRPPQPDGPDGRQTPERTRARRWRTALIGAAAVTSAALLTGLTWTVLDATNGFRDRGATASGGPSAPGDPSGSKSGAESESRGGDPTPDASNASPAGPTAWQAVPYPLQMLTEKNSLALQAPVDREDREGDLRFVCQQTGCALESDTSVVALRYGKPGASLEECRASLRGADSRRLPLAAAASGSEICVRHPSGDIALFVIQVKSTALPGSGHSFVTGDMTVWRAESP
ncbi:serine/threonine-protein kinase [Streptomyces sp. C11-1]|uniref:Serine/threonine-protein kinase n=1 Tax=Streptomyces durocortorensis TaxID=2811104 RepID=A0ABY9VVT0_9ACTN|nr:serine/threonine-protein kinase [Streptomyces durocortorensis]WNF28039.1 serine/threonine-protein kinase [Streptomyces durocortorensis]